MPKILETASDLSLPEISKGNSKVERIETFAKKTHNRFANSFTDSESTIYTNQLLADAKLIVSQSNSYYLSIAICKKFDNWQIELLKRDLEQLREIYEEIQCNLKPRDSEILTNIFKAIRRLLSLKKPVHFASSPWKLSQFLEQIKLTNKIAPHVTKYCFNPGNIQHHLDEKLRRIELLVKNVQIKTSVDSYQSAELQSQKVKEFDGLYFNIRKDIQSQYRKQISPFSARIMKEIEMLGSFSPGADAKNYCLLPYLSNIYVWSGFIVGDTISPYHGGIFYFVILFPADYPFSAPKIRFINQIFHPRVELETGKVLSALLGDGYSPGFSITKIIGAICELLLFSSDQDCANKIAAKLCLEDQEKYKSTIKEYILKFA